jgi:hypothetical protein
MNQENAPANSSLLTSCPANSAGYLSNSDRFHSDTAGEAYQLRNINNQKKLEADEFRRRNVYLLLLIFNYFFYIIIILLYFLLQLLMNIIISVIMINNNLLLLL